ncbi:ABC transporter ATP-binding protein [Agromyces fucosus]|uniref:ABC transporter ATP-binding protein n=1 Tax=Agromyces fucosus TaxID=41985 RepID=A0A4Q2JRM4_9MICO|nr:ABC transporter ATP-binding protein [Agromyces fucosus]RXZ48708.1 ABC transporter ATP-binding protein [Agromyces fucosus]
MTDTDAPKLRISELTKVFSTRTGSLQALLPVSFDVPRGGFVTLVGPSGCGKSTLLHIVAGLESPTSGTISVDGKQVTGPGRDRGMVFQSFALYPAMTVAKNVDFGLRVAGHSKTERASRVEQYLGMVGLSGFEEHYPSQLSGGMKQRVAIARSLAMRPDVLLMDEPFGALDAQTRIILQEDISRICREQQLTVLMITHAVEEAVFMSDRVLVMTARPGRIKEDVEIEGREAWRGGPVDDAYTSERFAYWRERIWSSVREEISSPRPA